MSAQALKQIATGQSASQTGAPDEARNPYDALKRQLERSKAEFMPLMGQSINNVDKFIRVVLNSVMATPDLLEADRRTLLNACMKAAQDGLLPDGREAVLNIYNTKVRRGNREEWVKAVQYLPMVGGLIKKLYASGEIVYIDAACVYERDRFVFRRGDDPKLEHEPTMANDCGEIIAAYVVIKLRSGEVKREVMPRRDIDKVRGASKAGESASGPWVKWFDQMAIKSVVKRVYKQLPRSDEFERLEASDNQAMGFAATPESVAEIVGRKHDAEQAHAAKAAGRTVDAETGEILGAGAPALAHDPSPVLEPQQQRGRQAEAVAARSDLSPGMEEHQDFLDGLDADDAPDAGK